MSFISQLYEPRYVTRQQADLPEEAAQRPVVYEGALEATKDSENKVANLRGKSMGGFAAPQMAMAPPPPPPMRQSMASGVVSDTIARELGDLFEYRINTPVTVRKSESAMLPFLQQKIDARKLLIYSDLSSVHPMNAAEVTNSSGKTSLPIALARSWWPCTSLRMR